MATFSVIFSSRRRRKEINDQENLARLLKLYQKLVFSLCLKITHDYFAADGLTQETFLTAYQKWSQFDGQNEKAWLCRIASNKAIEYLRKKKPAADLDQVAEPADRQTPLDQVLNQELMEELQEAVKKLPDSLKGDAERYFLMGKKTKEIAKELEKPLKTVQTHIYRARELLKNQLERRQP